MPVESLKVRLGALPPGETHDDLRILLQAYLDGLQVVVSTLCAKLDADATVTDTNYNALVSAALNAIIVD